MAIRERIKNLNYREFLLLCGIFISNPRYIWPTIKATRETIEICNFNLGSKHHGNNKANAFRHALWNYKLCEKTFSFSKSREESVDWAKKITDLHEKLSPNRELEKIMDLHNNGIGRNLFYTFGKPEVNMESILMKKMEISLQVNSRKEIECAGDSLVFIEKL